MIAPPYLVSYDTLNDFLSALSDHDREKYGQKIEALVEKRLPPVVSTQCLATLFGYSTKFLHSIRSNPEIFYREFEIRKGKKLRKISSPRVALKVIQKWFSYHAQKSVAFDESVCGFIPGKSFIDAAAKHCGCDWVYTVDIKDFFPSIKPESVTKSLIGIGYSVEAAQLLSEIFCLDGGLPQGSPASPFLSNLVFSGVDGELKKIAEETNTTYSRYADDLNFSGKGGWDPRIQEMVREILAENGFERAESKEDVRVKPQRLKVHGLIISGKHPRLTKGYRNRIRAYKHLIENGRVEDDSIDTIRGHLSFAKSVNAVDF